MLSLTRVIKTFPSVRLASASGGLPVEITLIAQLGPGAGDRLYEQALARQRAHAGFVDALDEPSTRLGGMDLAHDDPTSLYTFAVGPKGHPFHRHAGHRVFTAVSGSGGAQLRFSSASAEAVAHDPASFVQALRHVDIPADCLFTVRFGADTWHQFAPLLHDGAHPAFFALSCHTNELGGALSPAQRAQVRANAATIPSLTELLPERAQALLRSPRFDPRRVPTVALSLDAPAGTLCSALCEAVRRGAGRVRGALTRVFGVRGFRSDNGSARQVRPLASARPGSLFAAAFVEGCQHEDLFELVVEAGALREAPASALLAGVLEGFLENRAEGVSRLMAFRNWVVRPLGLRTSPLACPVSSLLTVCPQQRFVGRFPVLAQRVAADERRAEVLLGADDKHLAFRSAVAVEKRADGSVAVSLGTRVRFRNLFGRVYFAAIDHVHRGYVTPTMLRMAVDWLDLSARDADAPQVAAAQG